MPDTPRTVSELEERLSAPTPGAIAAMGRLEGDLVILGASGKMGPTLARMAKRASDAAGVARRITAVSRFSQPGLRAVFEELGIETAPCDLCDPKAVAGLPDAPNVLYMMGMKFGATGNEPLTWATNVLAAANAARRYKGAKMVALSTGNVYGLSDIASGGAKETDTLAPIGEYAMSALGRERLFEYHAGLLHTPMALIRLYYAFELRYGVPVDVARKVLEGTPINISMSHASVIWQGDANAQILEAFGHVAVPAFPINISGPAPVSIRDLAERFGRLLGRAPLFTGEAQATALVCNTARSQSLFGMPETDLDTACGWIADWLQAGGASLDKPTHFEDRKGHF